MHQTSNTAKSRTADYPQMSALPCTYKRGRARQFRTFARLAPQFALISTILLFIANTPVGARAASQLFAVDYFSGSFVEINKTNGIYRLISTPGPGSKGLAYDALRRKMYLLKEEVTQPPDTRVQTLFQIDPITGALSSPITLTNRLTGLTFDANFSVLYSVDGAAQATSSFWTINPITGETKKIGLSHIEHPYDLTTDSHGTVWGVSTENIIFTYDTSSGLATQQFDIGTGMTACAFDEDDKLYAVTLVGDNLILISNNTFQVKGPTGLFDIKGLVFATTNFPSPRLDIRFSQVELCFDTIAGGVYQIHYRSSLTTNEWVPFGGPITGTGARYCTNDTVVPSQPQKFYRVVIAP